MVFAALSVTFISLRYKSLLVYKSCTFSNCFQDTLNIPPFKFLLKYPVFTCKYSVEIWKKHLSVRIFRFFFILHFKKHKNSTRTNFQFRKMFITKLFWKPPSNSNDKTDYPHYYQSGRLAAVRVNENIW